jgi:hypothetical protein
MYKSKNYIPTPHSKMIILPVLLLLYTFNFNFLFNITLLNFFSYVPQMTTADVPLGLREKSAV